MLYNIPYNIYNQQISDSSKINANFAAISTIINAGLENDNFDPSSDLECASLICTSVYNYDFRVAKKMVTNLAVGESFKVIADTYTKIEVKENGDVYL